MGRVIQEVGVLETRVNRERHCALGSVGWGHGPVVSCLGDYSVADMNVVGLQGAGVPNLGMGIACSSTQTCRRDFNCRLAWYLWRSVRRATACSGTTSCLSRPCVA